jgi:hypothetical protein
MAHAVIVMKKVGWGHYIRPLPTYYESLIVLQPRKKLQHVLVGRISVNESDEPTSASQHNVIIELHSSLGNSMTVYASALWAL